MMEKYTPLMRERNANQPNTKATSPGTATMSTSVAAKLSDSAQCHGISFQSRNTMKAGRPSGPAASRIRCMPIT